MILTTAQAAAALGVNTSRVRQLILAGRLPAEKHGRDLLITKQALDEFSAKRSKREIILYFRVSEREAQAVKEAVNQAGVSLSKFVRQAVGRAISQSKTS